MNQHYPVGYFIGIIAFISTITIFIGYEIREQIRSQQKALLRSSTLENQLLKRSLQPHFLFNSLMSLQEWIETKPERSGTLATQIRPGGRGMAGKNQSGNSIKIAGSRIRLPGNGG